MIFKLLLGRLLPMGVAGAFLTSALSPLKPALHAFGVAAEALAGNSDAGGAPDLGRGLSIGTATGGDDDVPAPSAHPDERRKLEALASQIRGDAPTLKVFNAPEPARPAKHHKKSPRNALPVRRHATTPPAPRPKPHRPWPGIEPEGRRDSALRPSTRWRWRGRRD